MGNHTSEKKEKERGAPRQSGKGTTTGDEETLLQATGKIHEYYIYDREDTNKR